MKVAPYHANAVTEGRRMYNSPFTTCVRDCDKWWAPRPGRFNPGKNPVTIIQEAGLASWPVWTDTDNLNVALTAKPLAFRSLYIPVSSKEMSARFFVPL